MTNLESTETRQVTGRSSWPGPMVAVAIIIMVVVGVAVAACMTTNDSAPVAAGDARIEMTYTGDGVSYVGDREIIEGTADVTFSNETAALALVAAWRFDTGSDELANELSFLQEGDTALPSGKPLESGLQYSGEFEPGTLTWTMELQPGTYFFDVGGEDFETAGVWRVAVIEIVAN